MQKAKRLLNSIRENQRYVWVLLIIVVVFLINRGAPAQIISSDNCASGNCKLHLAEPALSDENPLYYVDEIFKSKGGTQPEFYRLVFDAVSDQDAEVDVFASNFLEGESFTGRAKLKKGVAGNFIELFFSVKEKYSNLTFKKANGDDGANISITNVRIARLDVRNEKELATLIPTKRNSADLYASVVEQTRNSDEFSQLCEADMIFGQIFKAPADYITAVALDMDIIKQGTGSGRKYSLDLREVNYDEVDIKIKSDILSDVNFDLQSIEQYRREDGKFQFPIFSSTQKDRHYFIGINNDRAVVDKFNCLKPRGSFIGSAYADGLTVVKTRGEAFTAPGDLYFTIYGPQIEEYQGKKFLFGSMIEGIGKNSGLFKYQTRDGVSNVIDLDSRSSDVSTTDNGTTIFGSTEALESNFIYKFETIYPSKKFVISGVQPNANWNAAKIQYSFDKKNWTDIPADVDDFLQKFNHTIDEKYPQNTIFVKVVASDEKDATKKSKYGIHDFRFEAEVFVK